ncbi:MAG: carboxypeptidase regulatory-like domain-containing protein [Gemmatimonadetes bacterium]|nr:carboxypeptidase regulatory-like domain-containing protein [Gemmatimonadota bacterium]
MTGKPVTKADIVFAGDTRTVTVDSAGHFLFTDLPAGIVRLYIRSPGYPVTTAVVALAKGDDMERRFDIDSSAAGKANAQHLPRVAISAPAPLRGARYADFERRRITGRGQYRTAEDIEKGNYNNLVDAVRDMRGVQIDCGGGAGCYIRMARAPMQCLPQYIVDDRPDPEFGPNIAIRDVAGIEVYNGPTDTPGEYAGVDAGCGVIVIWTRSTPIQHKP